MIRRRIRTGGDSARMALPRYAGFRAASFYAGAPLRRLFFNAQQILL